MVTGIVGLSLWIPVSIYCNDFGTSCCEVYASPPSSIFKQGTHFNSDKLRIGAFVLLPAVYGNSQTSQCKKLSTYFSLKSVLQSEAEQTKGNQDKHPSE